MASRTGLFLVDLTTAHWPSLAVVQRVARWSVKRFVDVVLAVALLALLSPLLLLIAVAIRSSGRGRVLFTHERVGYRRRPFRIYKFRTMISTTDPRHAATLKELQQGTFFKLWEDPRVTRLGRLLRKYSLDELPQLYNVVRGDMSLVGPRPLVQLEVDRLPHPLRVRRFLVRPGITGLWQVNGRNDCTDLQRMRYDLEYVDHWSLWLDLRILVKTVPAVLGAKGAY